MDTSTNESCDSLKPAKMGATVATSNSSHFDSVQYMNHNYKGSSTLCIPTEAARSGFQNKDSLSFHWKHQLHYSQHSPQSDYNQHQQKQKQARKVQQCLQEHHPCKDQEHYKQKERRRHRSHSLQKKPHDPNLYYKQHKDQEKNVIISKSNDTLEMVLPVSYKKMQKFEANLKALKLVDKSLFEMGFQTNNTAGWGNILQSTKDNLYKLLRGMIENHVKPNVQVRIGKALFNCHMMVLQCYSEFFGELDNVLNVHLPEDKITPTGFMMAYDWMLTDEPLVQRECILELLNAATFLRISQLINQCWICLDDDGYFSEDRAFLMYLEARQYNLQNLEELMLMRIYKFFLTLVSSKEFVDLEAKEVIVLLNSNTIGVNTEIEIFMSAVRWLNYDWEDRKQYVVDIIKTVRFNLMPTWFLVMLTKSTDCFEVDRILSCPGIKNMISDGITYTTTEKYYGKNHNEFLHILERYQLMIPMQRQWIYDENCNYHHHLKCPNMQNITYKAFLEYLEMLQQMGKEYWSNLQSSNTLSCTECRACSNK